MEKVRNLKADKHSAEKITNFSQIQNEIRNFIETKNECLRSQSNANTLKLSKFDKGSCEGNFHRKSTGTLCFLWKTGKCPGNAGFNREFYGYFFGELRNILVKTLDCISEQGKLSSTPKQAVITITKKKDCDKRLIQNWGPIQESLILFRHG